MMMKAEIRVMLLQSMDVKDGQQTTRARERHGTDSPSWPSEVTHLASSVTLDFQHKFLLFQSLSLWLS